MPRRILIASLVIALSLVIPARAASHPQPKVGTWATSHAEPSELSFPSPRPPIPRKPRSVSVRASAAPPGPVLGPWPHAPFCCGPSEAEALAMIRATFGIHADEAVTVALCESHADWQAQNPYSGAAGIFQFIPSWWWDGAYKWDVWDAQANISTAFSASSGGTDWSAWSCKP